MYNPELDTPMGLALLNGDIATVRTLLVEDPSCVTDEFSVYMEDYTYLRLACKWGQFEIAKALVEHGADVNAADAFQCTPLDCAYESGNRALAGYLIERGAKSMMKN